MVQAAMIQAKDDDIRQRVLRGERVVGAMVFEFFSPGMPAILHQAGCEFALLDMEHAGLGYETFKACVAACRGLPIRPMVRVPTAGYTWLARALDVGAEGVMVPMVESLEQARLIVESVKYPPQGRRGAAFGMAHDHYESGPVVDKIAAANRRNLVIAQIESERGLAVVEEIAGVDGIDVLWVGHFDLSNFLGIPGQFDSPVFDAAVERIVAAAKANGKGLGFMASDAAWAKWARAKGFNMIAGGPDHGLLRSAFATLVEQIHAPEAS